MLDLLNDIPTEGWVALVGLAGLLLGQLTSNSAQRDLFKKQRLQNHAQWLNEKRYEAYTAFLTDWNAMGAAIIARQTIEPAVTAMTNHIVFFEAVAPEHVTESVRTAITTAIDFATDYRQNAAADPSVVWKSGRDVASCINEDLKSPAQPAKQPNQLRRLIKR